MSTWFKALLHGGMLSIIFFMCNLTNAAESPSIKEFNVGVLATHGVLQAKERWQPMMDYLSQHVPNSRFTAVPLNYDEITQQLISNQLSFIITNPGQFLHLSGSYPLSWLATMRTRKHQGSPYSIGSAIIVRANSPINTLAELRGRNIAALDPQALGGYKAVLGLLIEHGFTPEGFFGQLRFLGFPNDALIYQVRDGNVDASITPFCTLEDMAAKGLVNRADYRVINGHFPPGGDCETSTTLYPGWSFAATELVSPQIALDVSQALFGLPANHSAAISADILGWIPPVSQMKTIELYNKLQKISPRPLENLYAWVLSNKKWGGGLLLLFIVSTLYHLWLEYKFRQKSEFLLSAERQLKDKALQLERLQSAAILGEIGAGLAHELNQPIAAITQYSEGARLQLARLGQVNPELYDILGKINAQSIRAGAVVHRIRGLLKRSQTAAEPLDVVLVIKEALVLLQRELDRAGVQVEVQVQGRPFELMGDSVGLSQLWVNLVKNSLDALEACKDNRTRKLRLEIHYGSNEIKVLVIDNADGLQGQASELMASFASTKATGLGLGLAICKDVVSRHHGNLTLENCQQSTQTPLPWQQGCVVTVNLPKA